jgi:hypothetical protein
MKDTHNDNSEAAISVVVDIQVRTCDADMANISRFVRKLWGVILASIPPNLLVSLRTALQMLDLFHLETCFVDPRRWYQPGALQHLSSMHDCALLLPGKCYRVSPRRRGMFAFGGFASCHSTTSTQAWKRHRLLVPSSFQVSTAEGSRL